MFNIPEFDIKILIAISKNNLGYSQQELVDKFGIETKESLILLLNEELVKMQEYNIKPFLPHIPNYEEAPVGNYLITDKGLITIKRWQTQKASLSKTQWQDRIWGFISGITITLIAQFIIRILLK